MIQCKSKYTGSTEPNVSGLNPSSKVNRNGLNHALALQQNVEDFCLGLSKQQLMLEETEALTNWMNPGENSDYDSLVSRNATSRRVYSEWL